MGGGPGTYTSGGANPEPTDPALNPNLSQWYSACSQGGKTKYPYGDTYDGQACEGAAVAAAPDGGYLPKKDVGARSGCRGSSGVYANVRDMSGSVAEFTDECKPVGNSALCAVRGGSFADTQGYLVCAGFGGYYPGRAEQTVGFRCCKDLP